jgi:hypothetical protein
VSATLTVTHDAFGIELRRSPLDVELDGTTVGSLKRHETFEAPIDPGQHRLQIRSGRYSSRCESFELADGDAVNFRCHPPMVWPRLLASLFVPSLGVSLKRK